MTKATRCVRCDNRSRLTENLQVTFLVSFVFLLMGVRTYFTHCSHLGEDFTEVGISEDVVEAGESFIDSVSVPSIPHGEQERREH